VNHTCTLVVGIVAVAATAAMPACANRLDDPATLRPIVEDILVRAQTGDLDALYDAASLGFRTRVTRADLVDYLALRRTSLGALLDVSWRAITLEQRIDSIDGVPTAWLSPRPTYVHGRTMPDPVVKMVRVDGTWRLDGLIIDLPELGIPVEQYPIAHLALGLPAGSAADADALARALVDDLADDRREAVVGLVIATTDPALVANVRANMLHQLDEPLAAIGRIHTVTPDPVEVSPVMHYRAYRYTLAGERAHTRAGFELAFDRVAEAWYVATFSVDTPGAQ
jgi:hypothetical protein